MDGLCHFFFPGNPVIEFLLLASGVTLVSLLFALHFLKCVTYLAFELVCCAFALIALLGYLVNALHEPREINDRLCPCNSGKLFEKLPRQGTVVRKSKRRAAAMPKWSRSACKADLRGFESRRYLSLRFCRLV